MQSTTRGLMAAGLTLAATGAVLPAVATPMPTVTRPVVARLADVNVNLGMTRKVTASAPGATSFEWKIWTKAKGWTVLARGGTSYATINFTGEAVRHMGLVQVTATNAAGRTTSNQARLRVWGIARDYPAAPGSIVKTGGWQISVGASAYGKDGYGNQGYEAKVTVTKLASPAARPVEASEMTYVTFANIENDVVPGSCSGVTPDYGDITQLAAGKSGTGYVCALDLTAVSGKGGRWMVFAYPSETSYVAGPPAWFRSA